MAIGPVTAAGGSVYSTATDGTDGSARKWIALGGTENLLVFGTITNVIGGNAGDFITVRVSKTAGEATGFTGPDSFGIGFRGDGQAIYYTGTNLGGAGTTVFGAAAAGVWAYAIQADENWVSATMVAPDGVTTFRARVARSQFNTGINNVAITTDDRRGAAGIVVNPLSIRKATVSPTPRATFAGVRTSEINGEDTRILLPPSFDSRRPAPVIISCHGNTQTQDHMKLSAQRLNLIKYFTDAGFIYASSMMSGNQWGAPDAVTDLVALYKYLRDHYAVGPLVVLGESMGGLATMNAVHRGALPIAGVGIVDGVMNLGWQYANGVSGAMVPDSDGIKAAYGIASNGSDYAAKTAGFDPALAPAANYRGVPIKFVASPDDTRVPKTNHADVLHDRISTVYPSTTSSVSLGGGHTVDGHFLVGTWGDYFRSCVATT